MNKPVDGLQVTSQQIISVYFHRNTQKFLYVFHVTLEIKTFRLLSRAKRVVLQLL